MRRVAPLGKILFESASASMRAAMTSRSASAYGSETGRPRAEDKGPDHSSFSVNHQGRFRDRRTMCNMCAVMTSASANMASMMSDRNSKSGASGGVISIPEI